jgi:predicted component of type VI protein secretion system
VIEPILKETLAGKPPLETRRRLEQMLKTMQAISLPLEPRLLRAVQALELIGNSESRAVLESLAKGAAAARQTREARESLERLDRRNGQLNVEPQINRD